MSDSTFEHLDNTGYLFSIPMLILIIRNDFFYAADIKLTSELTARVDSDIVL